MLHNLVGVLERLPLDQRNQLMNQIKLAQAERVFQKRASDQLDSYVDNVMAARVLGVKGEIK